MGHEKWTPEHTCFYLSSTKKDDPRNFFLMKRLMKTSGTAKLDMVNSCQEFQKPFPKTIKSSILFNPFSAFSPS